MLKKEAFHYMKKKLSIVTLLLASAIVATGCDSNEVTLKEENGKFMSIDDFQIKSKAGKSVIEMLTKFGCFEGMSKSNQLSLFG